MNLAGTAHLAAPPDSVFAAICDPATLLSIIPGARSVERAPDGAYRGLLVLRLPGAVGEYRTTVRLGDSDPPHRTRLDGSVEGSMGAVRGHADLTLQPEASGTFLSYRGAGTIDGPLARLDSGFVERLAQTLIGQGLRALDLRLAAAAAAPTRSNTPALPATSTTTATTAPSSTEDPE